jgi:hypothetical protein
MISPVSCSEASTAERFRRESVASRFSGDRSTAVGPT